MYFSSSLYALKTCSVQDFILDYNKFLWKEVKRSHYHLNHKIAASVKGNYHEETSQADKFVHYLYFQQKEYLAKVFSSSFNNPNKKTLNKSLI